MCLGSGFSRSIPEPPEPGEVDQGLVGWWAAGHRRLYGDLLRPGPRPAWGRRWTWGRGGVMLLNLWLLLINLLTDEDTTEVYLGPEEDPHG